MADTEKLVFQTDDGKEVEVNCHFCNKHYVFQVPELEELLKKAQR